MPPLRMTFDPHDSKAKADFQRALDKLGPRGYLQHRCARCSQSTGTLLVCTACNVVRYCCRMHQVDHRSEHKSLCGKIKRSRAKLAQEEDLVRNATPEPWTPTPPNAFESDVGLFWAMPSTRQYMRARVQLVHHLREIHTLSSITEAADHLLDMLRLNRYDHLEVRLMLPALLLQLGQDQECYDFVKWWFTTGLRKDYSFGDLDLPYLDIKNADVYEDVDWLPVQVFEEEWVPDTPAGDINLGLGILIVKLNLLNDVRSQIASRRTLTSTPLSNELIDRVIHFTSTRLISYRISTKPVDELLKIHDDLIRQCQQIGGFMCNSNWNMWKDFWTAEDFLCWGEDEYSKRNWPETLRCYRYNIRAVWQIPGVMELLSKAGLFGLNKRVALERQGISINGQQDMMEDNPAGQPNVWYADGNFVAGGRDMWWYLPEALALPAK